VYGQMLVEKWNKAPPVQVEKLKIYDCRNQPSSVGPLRLFHVKRHPDMEAAQNKVVEGLRSLGCSIQKFDLHEMKEGFDIWGALMYEESVSHHAPFRAVLADVTHPTRKRSWLYSKYEGSFLWAIVEFFKHTLTFGRFSNFTFPAVALGVLEGIQALTPGNNAKLRKRGEELKKKLNDILGDHAIMIFPSLPTPAPKHGLPFLFRAAESAATSIFNVLELPVCAVPLGLSKKEGLPVGVQIVGSWGNDHVVIAVANKLEEMGIAGWRVPVEVQ
jgi:fatty acid amide hydrolase 2